MNLVVGFDVALVQRAVLSIASKHDQTHQTTQTQDDLLAREHYVAGPGRTNQNTVNKSDIIKKLHMKINV